MKAQLIAALSLAVPTLALAQAEPTTSRETVPDAVEFKALAVPGFEAGAKIAVLHGDINAASGDYTIRLWLPAKYRLPAHWHPNPEHLTVLEGSIQIGMGDKYDSGKLNTYPMGSFLYLPAQMSHFGETKAATVVQLHGQAPFKIELTKPKP